MNNLFRIAQFYDAYSGTCFRLPTESDIEAFESEIDAKLPDDYREFLLRFNGGIFSDPLVSPGADEPDFRIDHLCGIHAPEKFADLKFGIHLFDDNQPCQILPIGGTPGDDLLMMNLCQDEDYGIIWLRTVRQTSHFVADEFIELFDLIELP